MDLVLCLEDRLAEKFMGRGGGLEMYGFIVIPGDGRPRKSGWYNDDWHKKSHFSVFLWERLRAKIEQNQKSINILNRYVYFKKIFE